MSMGAPNALILWEWLNFEGLKKELAYKLCSLVIEAVKKKLELKELPDDDRYFISGLTRSYVTPSIQGLSDNAIKEIVTTWDNVGWKRMVVEQVLIIVFDRLRKVKWK